MTAVPEREAGTANEHNGIKAANQGKKGPVVLRLKDCSVHARTLRAAIQQPFPRRSETHKGWHPTPTLQGGGQPGRAGSVLGVRHKQAPTRLKETCSVCNQTWSGSWRFFHCALPMAPLIATPPPSDSKKVDLPWFRHAKDHKQSQGCAGSAAGLLFIPSDYRPGGPRSAMFEHSSIY